MKKRISIRQYSLPKKLFCLFAAFALAFSMVPMSAQQPAYADAETLADVPAAQEQSAASEGESGVSAAGAAASVGSEAASGASAPAAQQPVQDTPAQEGAQDTDSQASSSQNVDGQEQNQKAQANAQDNPQTNASSSSTQQLAAQSSVGQKTEGVKQPTQAIDASKNAQDKTGAAASDSEPLGIVATLVKNSITLKSPALLGTEPTRNGNSTTVTVTFNAKGGAPVPEAQTFDAGGKATEPEDPAKDGWEPDPESWGGGFDGWYEDENYSGSRFDFGTEISKDITLYARWNGRIDVTSYDKTNGAELAGGTFACENIEESVTGKTQYGSSNVAEGTKVALTATPAEGYRFVGWAKGSATSTIVSTDATYEFNFTENNTVLNAVFEVKPLTITLVPTTIDGSKPVENYEFEILPGKSFRDVDGTEEYDAAVDHFKTAEGYSPYLNDLYLLPKELSNYTSWDEVEDADLYYYALNEDATYYVAMRMFVTETEIPVTVEAPVCGTETSFEVESEEVVDPESATNMPVVTIESGEVQPYDNNAAKRFWWTTEDATKYGNIFNGRFVGGNKYGVLLQFEPAFGYMFDKNNPVTVKVNGTVADTKVYSSSWSIDVIGLVTADHDWGEWVVTTDPTCTEAGEETRTCKNDASHTETREVAALDHDWGEWKVVKEPTETEKGLEERVCTRCGEKETRPVPKLDPIVYNNTAGDESSWTKGSGKELPFTFKRSTDDSNTIEHFTGIQVDGNAVDKSNYTAEAGSVVVTLKPVYLETLAVGRHTITAQFDDGSASADFTVLSAKVTPDKKTPAPTGKTTKTPQSKVAATADTAPIASLAVLALLAAAGAYVARRKIES